ncbi:MAG: DNA repair protein RadA [Candidatus Alectryocaccobium sp.]|nr:DNA repair protein RadA [Candidatus Alectryocaccobium sp.]
MAKDKKSVFFCQNCGYESAKWMGQCPSCRQWNTMVEEKVAAKQTGQTRQKPKAEPVSLSAVSLKAEDRIRSGINELDRVLGGGIVRGGLMLVGGDPGIGKSTLMLQLCQKLSEGGLKVLYVSGEESLTQIKMRAERIGSFSDSLKLLCETDIDQVLSAIDKEEPGLVIIDSIQTMFSEESSSSPGSVSQVREVTGTLLKTAKTSQIPIFIIGHVTKEGNVAGPRVLEHMVDTVLYFEGDRHASYRILRAVKNRFGSTNEIGVFEMQTEGLREVPNPSEYMLDGRPEDASGSVVACSMEGTRPVMIEIQALVCRTNFGFPRRTANGTDFNRVNLLMAVLEKRGRVNLSECDAYVNITGGIRMTEPAVDLGILTAIISSYRDIPVDSKTVVFGEVGLSGEIRSVNMASQRIREAEKLGFKRVILPAGCLKAVKGDVPGSIELIPVADIREVIRKIFEMK